MQAGRAGNILICRVKNDYPRPTWPLSAPSPRSQRVRLTAAKG